MNWNRLFKNCMRLFDVFEKQSSTPSLNQSDLYTCLDIVNTQAKNKNVAFKKDVQVYSVMFFQALSLSRFIFEKRREKQIWELQWQKLPRDMRILISICLTNQMSADLFKVL